MHHRVLSATIRAKNQALNENIEKVIRILRRFVLKAGFASEWLNISLVILYRKCTGRNTRGRARRASAPTAAVAGALRHEDHHDLRRERR
jgi:hypothetical protein